MCESVCERDIGKSLGRAGERKGEGKSEGEGDGQREAVFMYTSYFGLIISQSCSIACTWAPSLALRQTIFVITGSIPMSGALILDNVKVCRTHI